MLIKKLEEEVGEFIESNDPEELTDILEVIHAISQEVDMSFNKIENIRKQKRNQRSGFEKKYILENVKTNTMGVCNVTLVIATYYFQNF